MKNQYRLKVKEKLKSLSPKDIDTKSASLSLSLLNYLTSNFSNDVTIGAYIPYGVEPRWQVEFSANQNLAIPRLSGSSMDFVICDKKFINDHDGNYQAANTISEFEIVTPDVLLVPGLAFSKSGERLGKGKGFYDRYLETFTGKKIGICFDIQLFDQLPRDEWDKKVDLIITEKGKYNG